MGGKSLLAIFCGYDYLEWKKPIDPSSLSRWRNRLGKDGIEKIFQSTVKAAIKGGAVSARIALNTFNFYLYYNLINLIN